MPSYEEYKNEMDRELASFALNSGSRGSGEYSFRFQMIRKLSLNQPKKYVDDFIKEYLSPADKKLMEMVDNGMLAPIPNAKCDSYGNPKINQYVLTDKGNKHLVDYLTKNANDNYIPGSDYSSKMPNLIYSMMDKMYMDAGYGKEYAVFALEHINKVQGNYVERKAIDSINGFVQVDKANALLEKTNGKEFTKKDKENLLTEGINTISRLAAAHKSHGLLFKIFRYPSYKKENDAINNLKDMLVDKCGVKKETLDSYQESTLDYVDIIKNGRTLEVGVGNEEGKAKPTANNLAKFKNDLFKELKETSSVNMDKVFENVIGRKENTREYKMTVATLESLQDKIPVTMDEKFFNNVIENYFNAKVMDKMNIMKEIADRIIKDYDKDGSALEENDLEFEDKEDEAEEGVDYLNDSFLYDEGKMPKISIKEFIDNTYGDGMSFENKKEEKFDLYDDSIKITVKESEAIRKNAEISEEELDEDEIDFNNDDMEDEMVNENDMSKDFL